MKAAEFLRWAGALPAGARAEATADLARAFLHSPLAAADRQAIETALTVMLDDPSPLVRQSLAMAMAASRHAPPAVIHALAHDQPEIAMIVLAQSPLLADMDLIDRIAEGDWRLHCAIACRVVVTAPVCAMLAEMADADACQALLDNPGAALEPPVFVAILARHGVEASIRAAVLAREDAPPEARQAALASLSGALAAFAADQGWLAPERAARLAAETRDKATVALAGGERAEALGRLVRHLRVTGQLTTALILRALLSGHMGLVEHALAELSGMSLRQVSGLVHARGVGRGVGGFGALYDRAGLARAAYPAFCAALETWREHGADEALAGARLSRRMTERVLTSLADLPAAEVGHLLLMLRRFAAEAARDKARADAEELMGRKPGSQPTACDTMISESQASRAGSWIVGLGKRPRGMAA